VALGIGCDGRKTVLGLREGAKKAARLVAGVAFQKFGERISDQQEHVAAISDIIMEAFAMESVVLRTQKILTRSGAAAAAHSSRMARLLVHSRVDWVAKHGRDALAASSTGDSLRTQLAALNRFLARDPVDVIGLRREIAAHVISQGKYLV